VQPGGSQKRFYEQLIAKADSRLFEHLEPKNRKEGMNDMGRNLTEVMASLPQNQQAEIETRYQEMRKEVEGCENSARSPVRLKRK